MRGLSPSERSALASLFDGLPGKEITLAESEIYDALVATGRAETRIADQDDEWASCTWSGTPLGSLALRVCPVVGA
jgi:hypothetical protein